MSSFVRVVFTLLIAGSAIAFCIVFLADMRSERRQDADMLVEHERFADIISRYNGHLRHGDIAVEWQKVGTQQVMETSLLVRIYGLDSEGNEFPLPIQRVIIPHNRVSVDGLELDFDSGFPERYKVLRGSRLAYFDHIYAEEQPPDERFSLLGDVSLSADASARAGTPPRDERLSLIGDVKVPRDTAIHDDHVTHYEREFWENLWEMILSPKLAAKAGLKVVRLPAATCVVEGGKTYSIYLGFEGVKIVENTDPAIFTNMRLEAGRVDKEAADQINDQ